MPGTIQSPCCRHDLRVLSEAPRSDPDWEWLIDRGFTEIAQALKEGACPNLIRLDASGFVHDPLDWQSLEELLQSSACPSLKVLILDRCTSSDENLVPVLKAIEQGCCPDLNTLRIKEAKIQVEGAIALGHCLTSGNCPYFESLSIGLTRLFRRQSSDAITSMLQELRSVELLNLRSLDLMNCQMEPGNISVLGEILKDSICPLLEVLSIQGNYVLDEGVAHVIRCLEMGDCEQIRRLEMGNTRMGWRANKALACALNRHSSPRLQWLSIECDFDGCHIDEAPEVIKELRAYPCLCGLATSSLYMSRTDLAIAGALEDNCWPNLKTLRLVYQSEEESMGVIVDALATEGTARRLKNLGLIGARDVEMYGRLAQALRQGACHALKVLEIREDIGVESTKDLRKSIEGRAIVKRCPKGSMQFTFELN